MIYYHSHYVDFQQIFKEFLMDADADADSCNNNTVLYKYIYDLAAHRCG